MTPIADIMSCFESLGDNCEFGLAQRFAEIEPLGFFRLNNAPMPSLLRALRSDFAGVDDIELLVSETEPEYRVHTRNYSLVYHTEKFLGRVDPAALLAQQRKAVVFLVRKLREDLASGDKILVRKGDDSRTLDQIEPLFAELRRLGPSTLLWVVPEDHTHRAGTVEVLRAGLLKGYIDRAGSYGSVPSMSRVWLQICTIAHDLRRGGSAPGTIVTTDPAEIKSNLVLFSDRLDGTGWEAGDGAATTALPPDRAPVPWLRRTAAVAEHVLRGDSGGAIADLYRYSVARDLLAGETYVASLYVWIPDDFQGDLVRVHCVGSQSLQLSQADLRHRDRWQRIWTIVRQPDGSSSTTMALQAVGARTSRLYTTAWQLERADALRPYASGTCRPVNV